MIILKSILILILVLNIKMVNQINHIKEEVKAGLGFQAQTYLDDKRYQEEFNQPPKLIEVSVEELERG